MPYCHIIDSSPYLLALFKQYDIPFTNCKNLSAFDLITSILEIDTSNTIYLNFHLQLRQTGWSNSFKAGLEFVNQYESRIRETHEIILYSVLPETQWHKFMPEKSSQKIIPILQLLNKIT
jgi:hypothetical protein